MTTNIASPALWALTVAAVVGLFALDLALTRRPHDVTTREVLGWSAFYLALPLAFGVWLGVDVTWPTSATGWRRSSSSSAPSSACTGPMRSGTRCR